MAEHYFEVTLSDGSEEGTYTYSLECESDEEFIRAVQDIDERVQSALKRMVQNGTVDNVEGLAGVSALLYNE